VRIAAAIPNLLCLSLDYGLDRKKFFEKLLCSATAEVIRYESPRFRVRKIPLMRALVTVPLVKADRLRQMYYSGRLTSRASRNFDGHLSHFRDLPDTGERLEGGDGKVNPALSPPMINQQLSGSVSDVSATF